MIKAIVFDIGGVLIGLDLERCIHAFQDNLGFYRITELLDPCHQKGMYGELEAGRLAPSHFRQLVLAESRPGSRPEQVDASMSQLLAGMDLRTVSAVKELAQRYPLYLASNNNPISMPFCLKMLQDNGLGEVFQGQFISCDLKLMKPSAAFYQAVVQGIGLPAEEILFIDDSLTNVEGARAVGMQARLYIPGSDIALLLSDL